MKITIAGMGNAGTAIAADLTRKGHQVILLKTSDAIHTMHHKELLRTNCIELHENNSVEKIPIYMITDDFSQAFNDSEIVFCFVQTNYHEALIKKMQPYLKARQIVVLEPGYLSTAYFLGEDYKNQNIIIVEATSTPVDCRIINPGSVNILYRNVRNPIGVYPKKYGLAVIELLNKLDYNFVLKSSVMEISLHNPNLIVHTVGGILSIPRVEKTDGQYYMYREVFTPSVWRIVNALDNEKMSVLEKLGCEKISYVEACRERNSINLDVSAEDVFFDYARNSTLKAPTSVYDRFITEDVPQGLVLLESFGEFLGIPTHVCTSLIEIASAALDMDFRSIGRTLDRLNRNAIMNIINDSDMKIELN